jgi:hypothetical protein
MNPRFTIDGDRLVGSDYDLRELLRFYGEEVVVLPARVADDIEELLDNYEIDHDVRSALERIVFGVRG